MQLPLWLGALGFLTTLLCTALSSWTAAAALLPIALPRTRMIAAATIMTWWHAMAFYALSFTGWFIIELTLASAFLPAIAALIVIWRRPAIYGQLLRDVQAMGAHAKYAASGTPGVVTLGVFAVFTMQFIHALLAPPLAWDSLTYHLPRAAFWAQRGSLADGFEAPLAWEYFREFWPLGDSLSSQTMLLTSTDLFIPVIWMLVWVAGVGATYVAARELKARRGHAWVAALAVWSMPALARHAFVAHIENLMLMLIMASFALLVAADRERDARLMAIGLAAAALAATVKPSGLPYAAAAVLVYGFLFAFRFREKPLSALLAPLPGLACALPLFIRQAVLYGSPVYPFRLEIGGRVWFEASPEFAYILAHETTKVPWDYIEKLFIGGPYGGYVTHVNFSIFAAVVLILGFFGLIRVMKEGPSRVCVLAFVGMSLIALYTLLTTYTWTGNNIGRHVAAVPLLLVVCAATFRSDWIRNILGVVTFAHLVFFLPFNWYATDRAMLWELAPMIAMILALLAAAVWAVAKFPNYYARLAIITFVSAYLVVNADALERERRHYRYALYSSSARLRTYTNIKIGGRSGYSYDSVDIWRLVDAPDKPVRIAVTAGWDHRGINWFLYPLFGRKLQNTLLYVPPTRSGRVLSPRNTKEYLDALDYEAWKLRLAARKIDFVVSYHPRTPEARWMLTHPDDFRIIREAGAGRSNILARVRF